jgi:hypothetical protein
VDDSVALTRRWIEAYAGYRDDDLLELAHPEIVLHPRHGQGTREYRGLDGVRNWLQDVGSSRPKIDTTTIEALSDGRVIAETTIEQVVVNAVFEFRDDRISSVSVYLSDRELLERLGLIP